MIGSFSSLVAGANSDIARDVSVDEEGFIYMVGDTASPGLGTAGSYQRRKAGGVDVFVAKLSPSGRRIIFLTYFGGRAGDYGSGISVRNGHAYITGWTFSRNFPVTDGALKTRTTRDDTGEGFVARLNARGTGLRYSTFLGGSSHENPYDIKVDPQGAAYVAGVTASIDFPTENASQPVLAGLTDAFVSVLSPAGDRLLLSTYLGGEGLDQADGLDIGAQGSIHVVGGTTSKGFPTEAAIQPFPGSMSPEPFAVDAFVTEFSAMGDVVYSTYLGGEDRDFAREIVAAPGGGVVVAGETYSADFPVKNPFQPSLRGEVDGFITRLSADSELAYSTFLGGSRTETVRGLGLSGGAEHVLIAGETNSTDFPVRRALQRRKLGEDDVLIALLDGSGTSLRFGTYLGGRRDDQALVARQVLLRL